MSSSRCYTYCNSLLLQTFSYTCSLKAIVSLLSVCGVENGHFDVMGSGSAGELRAV
jgi:hypothetical protein